MLICQDLFHEREQVILVAFSPSFFGIAAILVAWQRWCTLDWLMTVIIAPRFLLVFYCICLNLFVFISFICISLYLCFGCVTTVMHSWLIDDGNHYTKISSVLQTAISLRHLSSSPWTSFCLYLLSPSGDLGIGLVWDNNPTGPPHFGPTVEVLSKLI